MSRYTITKLYEINDVELGHEVYLRFADISYVSQDTDKLDPAFISTSLLPLYIVCGFIVLLLTLIFQKLLTCVLLRHLILISHSLIIPIFTSDIGQRPLFA